MVGRREEEDHDDDDDHDDEDHDDEDHDDEDHDDEDHDDEDHDEIEFDEEEFNKFLKDHFGFAQKLWDSADEEEREEFIEEMEELYIESQLQR